MAAPDINEGFKYILKNLVPEDLSVYTPTQVEALLDQTVQQINKKYNVTVRKEGLASPPFAQQFVVTALTELNQAVSKANKGLTNDMVTAGATALKAATGPDATDADIAKAVYLAMQEAKPRG